MEHPHVNSGVLVPDSGIDGTELYRRGVTRGTTNIGMIKLTDEVLRREALPSSVWALTPVSEDFASPAGQALAELRELIGTTNVRDYRLRLPGTVVARTTGASCSACSWVPETSASRR